MLGNHSRATLSFARPRPRPVSRQVAVVDPSSSIGCEAKRLSGTLARPSQSPVVCLGAVFCCVAAGTFGFAAAGGVACESGEVEGAVVGPDGL